MNELKRCWWAQNPLSIRYHDEEWGVPSHDDQHLFEMIVLEGAQAGLSWATILGRRNGYWRAFSRFNPAIIARYDAKKMTALMGDPGIIRNRLKIESSVGNARAFLLVQKEFGSFDGYIWQFVGGKPRQNSCTSMKDVPAETTESRAMSKDLKRRGFTFVGPTVCYAFMQAVGMVNDHLVSCFRYREVSRLK
jgi:DNA-3-methyladenine glycosylase I